MAVERRGHAAGRQAAAGRRRVPPDRSRAPRCNTWPTRKRRRRDAGREAGLDAARDAFYRGDIARKIVGFIKEQGGLLSAEDMANYHSPVVPPERRRFRRSRRLHLRRLVPGADAAADPGAARRHRSEGARPQQRRLHPHADRGAETRLRRPRGLLHRPGFRQCAAADPDVVGIRRRAPQADPAGQGVARDAAAGPARRAWSQRLRASPPNPNPEPDTSYVCAADRWGNVFSATPSDGSYGSPMVPGTGLIPSSRGSQSRPDPKPSGRGRARQAAAPDAEPGAGDPGRHRVPAVRHAGRRRADAGDAAGAAQHLRARPVGAGRDREPAFRELQLPVIVLRPTTTIPAGSTSRAASRRRSPTSWRGAATRSSAGPTGSGSPARSARFAPTQSAASRKPAPTRAAPPTRWAGEASSGLTTFWLLFGFCVKFLRDAVRPAKIGRGPGCR